MSENTNTSVRLDKNKSENISPIPIPPGFSIAKELQKWTGDEIKQKPQSPIEKKLIHPTPIPEEKGQRLKDLYFKYIKDEDK